MYVTVLTVLLATMMAQAARRECRLTVVGFEYTGTLAHTRSGRPCQSWSVQVPHAHNYTSHKIFPDVTLGDAANYCRNPHGSGNIFGTWCFTTDPDVRWQSCAVPRCSEFPECRLTERGSEYKGHIDVTSSGRKCAHWPRGIGEKNYCRNPDGRKDGPYCQLEDGGGNETETCNIPFCKPAMHCKRTDLGMEYSGKISVTQHGRSCQRWADQYPHSHNHTHSDQFPDLSVDEAENYCRNPDKSSDGPWCYTNDPDTRRETCNIENCRECKVSKTGREYSGNLATSLSGKVCESWDEAGREEALKDPSRYPDINAKTAKNFCRNPDNDPEGPWCFVGGEKQFCDIPTCTDGNDNRVHPPRAKHVIHIGIDGLRPDCIEGVIGGAPNMMKRLAREGTFTLTRATTTLITVSAPGWSATLCGMDTESTGITSNDWSPPWRGHKQEITPVTGNDQELPCIFKELKSQDPSIRTGSFYDWEWFKFMSNRGYPGLVDKELFCPITGLPCDEYHLWKLKSYVKEIFKSAEKSYTFLYIGNVDSLAHMFSWCGFVYNLTVGIVDRQIGVILDTIEEASMEDSTVVIVNADHGGKGHSHGRKADYDLHVPMFIKGPGIKKGHTFQQDVRNQDIVPTVVDILGLKANPYWTGRVMRDAYEDL